MTKPVPYQNLMTRLTLPKLTFMIAVVILGLVLWPILGDAPWEDGVTEAELKESHNTLVALIVNETAKLERELARRDVPAVLPPPPTAESHSQGLSISQLKGILKQYIKSTGAEVNKDFCLFRTFPRMGGLGGTLYYLNDEVEWSYSSSTDLWNVTAAGNSCDGVEHWYVDDDTGKVSR